MPSPTTKFVLPLLILAVCLIVAAFGETARNALAYIRIASIEPDAIYRWLTAHIVHLGWGHLLLNMLGLYGVWSIYGDVVSQRAWALFIVICAVSISAGLQVFSPGVLSYVGLSGILHGLLIFGAILAVYRPGIRDISQSVRAIDAGLVLGVWAKIIYEQMIGAVPFTAEMSGGNVVVDAHLYGAAIGTILAIGYLCYRRVNP